MTDNRPSVTSVVPNPNDLSSARLKLRKKPMMEKPPPLTMPPGATSPSNAPAPVNSSPMKRALPPPRRVSAADIYGPPPSFAPARRPSAADIHGPPPSAPARRPAAERPPAPARRPSAADNHTSPAPATTQQPPRRPSAADLLPPHPTTPPRRPSAADTLPPAPTTPPRRPSAADMHAPPASPRTSSTFSVPAPSGPAPHAPASESAASPAKPKVREQSEQIAATTTTTTSSSSQQTTTEQTTTEHHQKKTKPEAAKKEDEDSDLEVDGEIDPDVSLLEVFKNSDPKQLEEFFATLNELNMMKKDISKQSKQNFQLMSDIAALEKKISLLIRNRITPEEILDAKGALMDTKDEKTIVMSDHATCEKYGRLLYLLRTQTVYISRLARNARLVEIEPFLQTVMFTLYGNQYEEDEEHLLLTMFKNVLFDDFNQATSSADLLRANTPLTRMLATYTRRGPGQQYLKKTLGPLLREITADPKVSYDIDPKKVYETWINDYEVREGKKYEGEKSPLPEVCAQFDFVKKIIEERVPIIKAVIDKMVRVLASSAEDVPYGIRFICRQIKQLVLQKFPDMKHEQVCGTIGGFFMLRFVNPAIATPNAHMLIEGKLNPVQRRNMTIIAKILQNLSNNIAFGGVKEQYMVCLNDILKKNNPILNSFLDSLTKVDDLEERLMSQYVALTKFSDPTITISLNELYFVHQMLWLYRDKVFAGIDDDEVYKIIKSFSKVPEQLPRSENANVEIKLVVISQQEDAQPSVVELEQLYGEVKYQVFKIMTMLPQKEFNAYVAKSSKKFDTNNVLDLLKAIQRFGSKTKHQHHLEDMATSVLAKLKTLLSHEVLSESDNLGRLRRDIAGDIRHISSRIKRTQASMEQLHQVMKSLEDARADSDAQMQVYAQYLTNVRVTATKSKGTKTKITKKDQKKAAAAADSEPVVKGPFRFSHSQLVKEGLILGCSLPEKISSHITYEFSAVPDKTGTYQAVAYWAKKRFDSATVTLNLEDLLERQSQNETQMDCDALVLNVNLVIRLINKYFFG